MLEGLRIVYHLQILLSDSFFLILGQAHVGTLLLMLRMVNLLEWLLHVLLVRSEIQVATLRFAHSFVASCGVMLRGVVSLAGFSVTRNLHLRVL